MRDKKTGLKNYGETQIRGRRRIRSTLTASLQALWSLHIFEWRTLVDCTFLYIASLSQSRITMFFRLARTSISFFLIRTSETRPAWLKKWDGEKALLCIFLLMAYLCATYGEANQKGCILRQRKNFGTRLVATFITIYDWWNNSANNIYKNAMQRDWF